MKWRLLIISFLLVELIHAQRQDYCIKNRFTNAVYFKNTQLENIDSLAYGEAKDWHGHKVTLTLSIIYPKFSVDHLKKRPLIALLPGGGFMRENMISFFETGMLLAQRGFVVAIIRYRVGWDSPRGGVRKKWDSTFYKAEYRAVQDSKAALRFLVHNADKYGIDTSWIFVAGGSAGGNITNMISFLSQADWNKSYPRFARALGTIDNSTNQLTDKFSIKGAVVMWGGISDTSYITREAAKHIAMLMFQGTDDKIIPYTKSGPPDHPEMVNKMEGTYLIAQRYKHLGGCYQLNTKIKGDHGEDFSSEFIAGKIGSFCKSLFCGKSKSEEFSTQLYEESSP